MGKGRHLGGQPGGADKASCTVWWHTDPMEVSAGPADVEPVTIRYLMFVLLPAWFVPGVLAMVASLTAVPYAEELWRCAKARKL
jgi:hypothetical protein